MNTEVRAKRVTVMGLGRFGGGIAVAKWLCSQGAKVLVTDYDPAEKLTESLKQLSGLPIEFALGGHREQDFRDTDLLVASPAVKPDSPYLKIARAAGVPITTEICLFIERCKAPIVGVTGTKGKSTTTSLLHAMLATQYNVWLGGNIGKSLLFDLDRIQSDDWVLLELSSYMLVYLSELKWSPRVAVVTMLSADHLEWHKTLDNYIDAKRNIVRFQKPDDIAVMSADCPLRDAVRGKRVTYPLPDPPHFDLKILGEHNQLNAQTAWATARELGVTLENARRGASGFAGLAHRLEVVHESNGIQWVNDSIATIPEASIAACDVFPKNTVIQIIGGSDKGLDMTAMCDHLRNRAKAVLCIGQTGESIAKQIGAKATYCADLQSAVARAKAIAQAGDVILLSPGFPSFGQFVNFEARGEMFRTLARSTHSA